MTWREIFDDHEKRRVNHEEPGPWEMQVQSDVNDALKTIRAMLAKNVAEEEARDQVELGAVTVRRKPDLNSHVESQLASLADTVASALRNSNLSDEGVELGVDLREFVWRLSYETVRLRAQLAQRDALHEAAVAVAEADLGLFRPLAVGEGVSLREAIERRGTELALMREALALYRAVKESKGL